MKAEIATATATSPQDLSQATDLGTFSGVSYIVDGLSNKIANVLGKILGT